MALEIAPEHIIGGRYRRGPQGKKDRLDKTADRAKKQGMSYGKYVALAHEGLLLPAEQRLAMDILKPSDLLAPPEQNEPQELTPDNPRIGGKRYVAKRYPPRPCQVCGKMWQPRAITAKYCSEACRNEAGRVGARDIQKRYRDKVRESKA